MRKENQRNGWIDLCRFIAAYGVVWLHFGRAPIPSPFGGWGAVWGGGLFVEYFFILSGYFAISHIEKQRNAIEKDTEVQIGKYILKKYLHFIPYAMIAVIMQYSWILCIEKRTWKETIKLLFMAPFEGLLLRNTGINMAGEMGILWYLSAMLIALPIVLYVATKFSGIFRNYLMWVLPLFVYGVLIRQIGTVRTTNYILSDFRAAAGLILGGSIYYLSQNLQKIEFTCFARRLMTVLEVGLFGLAVLFTTFSSLSKTFYDIVFIFLIFLSLIITFSGISATSKLKKPLFAFLGKISLPVYCFHFTVIEIVKVLMKGMDLWIRMVAVGIGSFIVACLMQWFIDKILPQILSGVRHCLIVKSNV